jgi:glycosyltransferase 2 family protein
MVTPAAPDETPVLIVEPPPVSSQRSACDLLRLIVATVALAGLLVVETVFGDTLVVFTTALLHGLRAIPSWLFDVVVSGSRVFTIVFLGGGLLLTIRRGRWRLLATSIAAAGIAVLLTAVLEPIDPATEARVVALHGVIPNGFPSAAGVAAAGATVTTAAPWLTRRSRRFAWLLIVVLMLARFLVSPIGFESVRALIVGWFAGSLALVALGGPSRRPRGSAIAVGLAAAGVPLQRLERAGVDARGSTPYFAKTTDDRSLFVKALGADERSSDLLFRLYRKVVPHDLGDERPFSSLRRTVEHEALVALMAKSLGIRTPALVTLTRADPNAFVLAYQAVEGRSLDKVEVDELTDELLRNLWRQVVELHSYGIAHRDLRLANLFRSSDGSILLIDFGFSELAASDVLITTDSAELLASTATRVGAERAVACARDVVGQGDLTTVLARLQPWALSGATRTALKQDPSLLHSIRVEIENPTRNSVTPSAEQEVQRAADQQPGAEAGGDVERVVRTDVDTADHDEQREQPGDPHPTSR